MTKNRPVFLEQEVRTDSVVGSSAQLDAIKAAGQKKSMVQRKEEFNEKYKDWIAEQNAWVEKYGVAGEDLRPW